MNYGMVIVLYSLFVDSFSCHTGLLMCQKLFLSDSEVTVKFQKRKFYFHLLFSVFRYISSTRSGQVIYCSLWNLIFVLVKGINCMIKSLIKEINPLQSQCLGQLEYWPFVIKLSLSIGLFKSVTEENSWNRCIMLCVVNSFARSLWFTLLCFIYENLSKFLLHPLCWGV